MEAPVSRPSGFALPLVVIVLVVISALAVAASFSANQEHRAARSAVWEEQAFAAAEYGLNRTLARWNTGIPLTLAVGAVAERVDTAAGGVIVRTRVTRVSDRKYVLVAEATGGPGPIRPARRSVGTIVRIEKVGLPRAAVMTSGRWAPTGYSSANNPAISGFDTPPPQWSGCSTGDPVPSLLEADTANPDWNRGSAARVLGNPPAAQDAVAADSMTYFHQPGIDWDVLKAAALAAGQYWTSNASNIGPSLAAGGTCNRADRQNWGEPRRDTLGFDAVDACQDYFPVIYVDPGGPGRSLSFSSGRGQGVLLVNGDLVVSGRARFSGLILVRGAVEFSGGGNKLYGAVMAWNPAGVKQSESGGTNLFYSSCALARALSQAHPGPTVLKHRAWSDMF